MVWKSGYSFNFSFAPKEPVNEARIWCRFNSHVTTSCDTPTWFDLPDTRVTLVRTQHLEKQWSHDNTSQFATPIPELTAGISSWRCVSSSSVAIMGSVRAIGSGQVFFSTSCRNVLQVCMCEVWERRGWEDGRAGGECSSTLGTSTICTVHLISLHHSLLLSSHPLVRCWSREVGFRGFWKTHIKGHQFSSTKCKNSIILGHMQHSYSRTLHKRCNKHLCEATEVYSLSRSLACESISSLCFVKEQPLRYDRLVPQKINFI